MAHPKVLCLDHIPLIYVSIGLVDARSERPVWSVPDGQPSADDDAEKWSDLTGSIHLKAHRTAASLRGKKGGAVAHRAQQGRAELEVAHRDGWQGASDRDVPERRPDLRLHRGSGAPVVAATRQSPPGRPWLRSALVPQRLDRTEYPACIPSRKCRKVPIPYDAVLYHQRHRIENAFARLKDRRRIATHYDRCADLFLSACALAAIVMFWLSVLTLVIITGKAERTDKDRARWPFCS